MAGPSHVLLVYGTRPEVIKLFPVYTALRDLGVSCKTVFTGQQTDLIGLYADLLPAPDFRLTQSVNDRSVNGLFAYAIEQADDFLAQQDSIGAVIVQGDTTTAAAWALSAYHKNLPVLHVEAGLRTHHREPFPEEMNRHLIGQIAAQHFAPTRLAVDNLVHEGVAADTIHHVGNTVIDAVQWILDHRPSTAEMLRNFDNTTLVTIHRRENWGERGRKLLQQLATLARAQPEQQFMLFSHPNQALQYDDIKVPNMRVMGPLPYDQFLMCLERCRCIISDSGGIQEEAAYFGKRILVLRQVTERPEVIDAGIGKLATEPLIHYQDWLFAGTADDHRFRFLHGRGDAGRHIARIVAGCLQRG